MVGKSTLVLQVLKKLDIPNSLQAADAVDPKDGDWIRRIWESARVTMSLQAASEYLLVIDEVQKLDNWSEFVKREWDAVIRLKSFL